MSLVTVVVAIFNGERYVGAQIESVLSQTHMPHEVIVSDNGSSDRSIEVVRAAFARRPVDARNVRLTVLHAPEDVRGVAANVAFALGHVSTPLFSLADQDDVWLPERLERSIAAMGDNVLVGTDAFIVDATLRWAGRTVFGEILDGAGERVLVCRKPFEALLRGNFMPGMTMTGRTEFAQSALPAPDRWIHDYWLAIAAAAVGRLAVLDEPLVLYRQHSANQLGLGSTGLGHWLTGYVRKLGARLRRQRSLLEYVEAHDWSSNEVQQMLDASVSGAADRCLWHEKLRFERSRRELSGSRAHTALAVAMRVRSYRRHLRDWRRIALSDGLARQAGPPATWDQLG